MALIVLLIGAGLLLLFLETILPGLVAGALGCISLFAATFYAYSHFGSGVGNATVAVIGILLVIGALLWVKFFPDSRFARVFVSHRQIGTVGAEKPELLGQSGTALTPLRPAGTVLVGQRRVDVVTEGGFVQRGETVTVVAIEGLRVVVRPSTLPSAVISAVKTPQ